MKRKYMMGIVVALIFLTISSALYWHQRQQYKSFAHLPQFNLTLTGSNTQQTPEETTFNQVFTSASSEKIFSDTLKDMGSTAESKMYALCGLRKMKSSLYAQYAPSVLPTTVSMSIAGKIQKVESPQIINQMAAGLCD